MPAVFAMTKKATKKDARIRVEVTTPRGTFAGFRQNGVRTFRGVPYATAGRFEPPGRIEAYGQCECWEHGPASPQPELFSLSGLVSIVRSGHAHVSTAVPAGQSETECLNMQLYVPDDGHGTSKTYPTFVFVHGGAFIFGSNKEDMYQQRWGSKLAATQRIAVVLVNYRLSCFGFCRVPGGLTNLGLRDVVAALQFIQEDGACFGLDPTQVTLGGESAGGMITGALLRAPSARGLFRRAFIMSGGTENILPVADADSLGEELASKVDVHSCSTMELLRAAIEMTTNDRFGGMLLGMPFQPVLDGDFLVDPPCAEGLDILLGVTENEGLFWLPRLPFELALRSIKNAEDVMRKTGQLLEDMGCKHSQEDLAELVQLASSECGGSLQEAARRLCSVISFDAPCLTTADQLRDSNRVFAYRNMLGPSHGGELPYLFGNWKGPVAHRLLAGLPMMRSAASDREGQAMEQLWGKIVHSFVSEGRPGTAWPRYDQGGKACALSPSGPCEVALTTATIALVQRVQTTRARPFGIRIPEERRASRL